MLVDIVLLAAAGVATLIVLGVIVWALTRPADRIQMATLCLVLLVLIYGGIAFSAFARIGTAISASVLLPSVFALLLYCVIIALAIYCKRWAWRASVVALSFHLLFCLVFALRVGGAKPLSGAAIAFVIGAIGLWACLHPGSRRLFGAKAIPGA